VVEPFGVFLRFQYSKRKPDIVNLNRKCIYRTFKVGQTVGKAPFVRPRVQDNIKMCSRSGVDLN